MPEEPLKWAPVCERFLEQYERIEKEEHSRERVLKKWQYSLQPSYERYRNSGRMRLASLEGAFAYLFEKSGFRLGYQQERLIKVVIIAFLRKMFGDDLISNLKYLEKKFQLTDLNDTVAILFPRRSGKTVAMAVMIACIAVSQPDGNCIMYNLTARQAEEFLAEALKHLNEFRGSAEYDWREVKRHEGKMIRIHTLKYDTDSSIKSYACALKNDGTIDSSSPLRCEKGVIFPFLPTDRGCFARAHTHIIYWFCLQIHDTPGDPT